MALPIQVDISKLPGLLLRTEREVQQAFTAGVRSSAHYARGFLLRRTPKDRGGAQHGWAIMAMGAKVTIGLLIEVYNHNPIIGILELGARPHPVSIEGQRSIYEWVERHFRLVGHMGGVMSGREIPEGVSSNRLTAVGSRRHRMARENYRDKLTKLGFMLEDNLVRNFPEMGRRLVPDALNIAALIIQKLRKRGQKPLFIVRGALDHLRSVTQQEVEERLRALATRGAPS
jgi:hypothetical protein